jgi:hypothetical protein
MGGGGRGGGGHHGGRGGGGHHGGRGGGGHHGGRGGGGHHGGGWHHGGKGGGWPHHGGKGGGWPRYGGWRQPWPILPTYQTVGSTPQQCRDILLAPTTDLCDALGAGATDCQMGVQWAALNAPVVPIAPVVAPAGSSDGFRYGVALQNQCMDQLN